MILFYCQQSILFFLSTRYCILKVEILGAKRDQLVICLQNVHQGNLRGTLVRFLKAREWSVPKAHKMVRHQNLFLQLLHSDWEYIDPMGRTDYVVQLLDCLNWRIQNGIDSVLAVSTFLYVQNLIFLWKSIKIAKDRQMK